MLRQILAAFSGAFPSEVAYAGLRSAIPKTVRWDAHDTVEKLHVLYEWIAKESIDLASRKNGDDDLEEVNLSLCAWTPFGGVFTRN